MGVLHGPPSDVSKRRRRAFRVAGTGSRGSRTCYKGCRWIPTVGCSRSAPPKPCKSIFQRYLVVVLVMGAGALTGRPAEGEASSQYRSPSYDRGKGNP